MITFNSKKEATEYLNSLKSLEMYGSRDPYYWCQRGTYVLSHGEFNRPDYMPRRYKDGWGIHRETYYYQGTFNAPKPCRIADVWEDDLCLNVSETME